MRAFVAFPIAPEVTTFASRVRQTLQAHGLHGKWTAPENLHLTLLFLGSQTEEGLECFREELTAAVHSFQSFQLSYAGLQCFGHPPRLLYLGWDGPASARFAALASAVQTAAQSAGLSLDPSVLAKTALPHLTLVRLRSPGEQRILPKLCQLQHRQLAWNISLPEPEGSQRNIRLDKVVLYQSQTLPSGAVHTPLHEVELARPS
jgi:2'-5' RNA ligase